MNKLNISSAIIISFSISLIIFNSEPIYAQDIEDYSCYNDYQCEDDFDKNGPETEFQFPSLPRPPRMPRQPSLPCEPENRRLKQELQAYLDSDAEPGRRFVLRGICFQTGQIWPDAASDRSIRILRQTLEANPDAYIRIEHSMVARMPDGREAWLAERRAQTLARVIMGRRIAPSRIEWAGFAQTKGMHRIPHQGSASTVLVFTVK